MQYQYRVKKKNVLLKKVTKSSKFYIMKRISASEYITVGDRIIWGMQDIDFAQI